ncbi:UDP-glucuronosyl/UDP-glucosyltransferase [Parasponia andersonii]|uniref:UDP-glucuronosyl/UDP-glucosyltransferase n=1 Tax=Parasponia andersonii TaxID=3476 RepID=A0A2P5CSK2_PARAD|nr:UDP-glucuronosyl/UDP-glucosyltransferase [Parasponia andersonii]
MSSTAGPRRWRSVGAFLSHCGWNSTLEALTAEVPMLRWLITADQFINAKLLVDYLGVAVRVGEGDRVVPGSGELARVLAKSLDEARPERIRVKKFRDIALKAVRGGSSHRDLDDYIQSLTRLDSKIVWLTETMSSMAGPRRWRSVGAFLSHCGWNSTLEALTAEVPMLSGSSWRGRPGGSRFGELARVLAKSLDEARPERIRVKKFRDIALKAVRGGSSHRDLDELVKRMAELN